MAELLGGNKSSKSCRLRWAPHAYNSVQIQQILKAMSVGSMQYACQKFVLVSLSIIATAGTEIFVDSTFVYCLGDLT